jgi:hypothetical protein
VVATTPCPLCGDAIDLAIGMCSCGYNAREVAALELEIDAWRRRRRWSAIMATLGFGILLVVPAVSVGAAAAFGGLLVSAGMVLVPTTHLYMRVAQRALRAATKPNALPEARIV